MNHLLFDNENKIKFLVLSVKGHDIIHDFNTTSMSDRLNKIAAPIGRINSTLLRLIGGNNRGGGNRYRSRERNRYRSRGRNRYRDRDRDRNINRNRNPSRERFNDETRYQRPSSGGYKIPDYGTESPDSIKNYSRNINIYEPKFPLDYNFEIYKANTIILSNFEHILSNTKSPTSLIPKYRHLNILLKEYISNIKQFPPKVDIPKIFQNIIAYQDAIIANVGTTEPNDTSFDSYFSNRIFDLKVDINLRKNEIFAYSNSTAVKDSITKIDASDIRFFGYNQKDDINESSFNFYIDQLTGDTAISKIYYSYFFDGYSNNSESPSTCTSLNSQIKEFIDFNKLYILGCKLSSNLDYQSDFLFFPIISHSQRGGSHKMSAESGYGSESVDLGDSGKIDESEYSSNIIGEHSVNKAHLNKPQQPQTQTDINVEESNKDNQHVMILSKFNQAILTAYCFRDEQGNLLYSELIKYYELFMKLYTHLYHLIGNKFTPLEIFNSSFIHKMLVLSLITQHKYDNKIIDILYDDRKTENNIKFGGARTSKAKKLGQTLGQRLIKVDDDWKKAEPIYNTYIGLEPSAKQLKTFINDFSFSINNYDESIASVLAITDLDSLLINLGFKSYNISRFRYYLEPKHYQNSRRYQSSQSNALQLLNDIFFNKLDKYKSLKLEHELLVAKIDAEQKRVRLIIQEEEAKTQAAIQRALESGKITPSDIVNVNNINKLVAQGMLRRMELLDKLDKSDYKYLKSLPNYLKLQIIILYKIAREKSTASILSDPRMSDAFSQNPKTINHEHLGIGSLDTQLLTGFKNIIEPYGANVLLDKTKMKSLLSKISDRGSKFIIDNAAQLDNAEKHLGIKNIKDKKFCPISSIIDAQSQCSFSTSEGSREYGEIQFMISDKENKHVYQTNSELNINNQTINIDILISNTGYSNISISSLVDIKTGSELSANVVYKSLLSEIIKIWESSNFPGNTEADFWNYLSNEEIETNDKGSISKSIFSKIISKGGLKSCGDFFQETNTALKNSSYNPSTYLADSGILSPNKLRLGLMGDRPSGIRLLFMILYSILGYNPYAIGGYVGQDPANNLLVFRKSKATMYGGGGKKKSLKKKKNRQSKNTKKRRKYYK